jgi:hypothetical protein
MKNVFSSESAVDVATNFTTIDSGPPIEKLAGWPPTANETWCDIVGLLQLIAYVYVVVPVSAPPEVDPVDVIPLTVVKLVPPADTFETAQVALGTLVSVQTRFGE